MNAPQKVGNPTPESFDGIPMNEDTRGDSNVASLIRAELRRAQRLANERDYMRALYRHKPDGDAA